MAIGNVYSYKRKTKEKIYAVCDEDKVLGIGSMIDLATQFNCNRHTINATYHGKMRLRGMYSVRLATDEEVEASKEQNKVNYADANMKPKIDTEEVVKHTPKPYRSSSARRFTPL